MNISNNYLSGIADEALPSRDHIVRMDVDNDLYCLSIRVPDIKALPKLFASFVWVSDSDEVTNELINGVEIVEDRHSPRLLLLWPGIDCPDWQPVSA